MLELLLLTTLHGRVRASRRLHHAEATCYKEADVAAIVRKCVHRDPMLACRLDAGK